jgi:hypothetical protein
MLSQLTIRLLVAFTALSLNVSSDALAQTVSKAPATASHTVAGCYELTVGEWSPADRNPAYHRIPRRIRLDTLPASRDGGWVLSPNIAFPYHGAFPGTPRWSLVADTLRFLWSNGYQVTIVTLQQQGSLWTGEAVAESDERVAGAPLPRAQVAARRTACQ